MKKQVIKDNARLLAIIKRVRQLHKEGIKRGQDHYSDALVHRIRYLEQQPFIEQSFEQIMGQLKEEQTL